MQGTEKQITWATDLMTAVKAQWAAMQIPAANKADFDRCVAEICDQMTAAGWIDNAKDSNNSIDAAEASALLILRKAQQGTLAIKGNEFDATYKFVK